MEGWTQTRELGSLSHRTPPFCWRFFVNEWLSPLHPLPIPTHTALPPSSGVFCEHPPPMVLLQTSPCDQYECQNGAQCIIVQQEPTCRCPPGFAGPRCEKLITVNFVGKDSYVELASAKVRPQANISLQVCPVSPCPCKGRNLPSSDCIENSWVSRMQAVLPFPPKHHQGLSRDSQRYAWISFPARSPT